LDRSRGVGTGRTRIQAHSRKTGGEMKKIFRLPRAATTSGKAFLAALVSLGITIAAGTYGEPAAAQDFPNKPLHMIVPLGPGRALDIFTRIMAPPIAKVLGQPTIVENKPGAGGLVGYEYVAKRVPVDGYNLVTAGSHLASIRIFVKDLTFDPVVDLLPLGMLV